MTKEQSHTDDEDPLSALLDKCVDESESVQSIAPLPPHLFDVDAFLAAEDDVAALRVWMADRFRSSRSVRKEELLCHLSADIALIDDTIQRQVNATIHHPEFRRLEASWRGLHYLVRQNKDRDVVKIRVLNVTWTELARDIERAIEFDQSHLFRKVYSNEFGMPGGEPFGVLLGDFEIRHRPEVGHPVDDLGTLTGVAQVAAASFAPFFVGAHPHIFGIDEFHELERPLHLPRTFQQTEYLKWRTFRESEDSRFVGLVLPRVLMRSPYTAAESRQKGLTFEEFDDGEGEHLWGSAVYAVGSVLVRSFEETRWLAQIRGVRTGRVERGLVDGLVIPAFDTESDDVAIKCGTDVVIGDGLEVELAELGFIALCACKDSPYAAFYSMPSAQRAKRYEKSIATKNAQIASMLQYTFCVSRFAHYLKILGRENVGRFRDPEECEDMLYHWLQKYVTTDGNAAEEIKARYPLQEATVEVREQPGKPGVFTCIVRLRPHFQLEQLVGSVKIVTDIEALTIK